jgi:hypothetical protein
MNYEAPKHAVLSSPSILSLSLLRSKYSPRHRYQTSPIYVLHLKWETRFYIYSLKIQNYSVARSNPVFLKLSAVADHSQAVGAHADHQPIFRKIPHTHKCMQVNRRTIIPVVKVTRHFSTDTYGRIFHLLSVWYNFCAREPPVVRGRLFEKHCSNPYKINACEHNVL